MAHAPKQQVDSTLFEGFTPLNSLGAAARERLATAASVENICAGDFLFERGDTRQRTYYLLEGEIELCSPLSPTQKVTAGSEAGRYPLAHAFPRQVTAMTVSDVRVLILPLDVSEFVGQAGARPAGTEQLWERRWLESPLLRRLSPEHKRSLLASMEEITVRAGQAVIHQDDPADSYYVVKKGRCCVTRKPSPSAREVKLAELAEGQGFGEEALITDVLRNASVSMLTDGILLRLSKEAFIAQMARPLLHHLPFQHAIKLVEQGAVLVDARTPEEFETDGLIGSLNMPLPVLRLKAGRLNRDRAYIVYSNAGQTSSVAVFLMLQQGLNACVLEGGLNSAPKSRMKNGGAGEPGGPGNVLSFPNTTQPDPQPVDWNNLSDDVLWRTTLGYRDDAGVEAALTARAAAPPRPAHRPQQPVGDGTLQGFDDIRLFTTIDSLQDVSLAPDDDDAQAAPPPPQPRATMEGRPHSTAAGPSSRPLPPQWQVQSSRGPGRRIGLVVLLVAIGGGLGYLYLSSGRLPEDLQAASPVILEQQRKLDAKVSRLLNAIETMPAFKTDSKDKGQPAPTPPAGGSDGSAAPADAAQATRP